MNIMLGYVDGRLHPETVHSLDYYSLGTAEYVDASGDPFAYWRAMSRFWVSGDDLMTVEHDNVIHGQVIPQFLECPEPWCSFGYPTKPGEPYNLLVVGLGCTRFRKELLAACPPHLVDEVQGACKDCRGVPGCWRHCDVRIRTVLYAAGYKPHVHYPPVGHLNAVLGREAQATQGVNRDLVEEADWWRDCRCAFHQANSEATQ